jgi:hypothetical protein
MGSPFDVDPLKGTHESDPCRISHMVPLSCVGWHVETRATHNTSKRQSAAFEPLSIGTGQSGIWRNSRVVQPVASRNSSYHILAISVALGLWQRAKSSLSPSLCAPGWGSAAEIATVNFREFFF